MNNGRYPLALWLFILCSTRLLGQEVTKQPGPVKIGDPVAYLGNGLDKVSSVQLQLPGSDKLLDAQQLSKSAGSLVFTAPDTAGTYSVLMNPGNKTYTLSVTTSASPAPPRPVIESVFPATSYPVQEGSSRDRFNFEINGEHFSPKADSNDIEVEGQGLIPFDANKIAGATPEQCETSNRTLPCLGVDPDGRRLLVVGFPRRNSYQGPMRIRVRVAGAEPSEWSKNFTLSRVSNRIVTTFAIVIFALLAWTVYALVRRGIADYTIDGRTYSPLAAFLIDKQTDSYSLSKLQLFLFSIVAVFGYIYVFMCRALVQWNFSFPDIPDNYPSFLAVSAGTVAVAAGLNSTVAPKGSGPVHPSAADFISNGGLVIAERFQFFVWTLVASIGFVVLILLQDPSQLTGFPAYPTGLLYLMGVSAAGYLGGKAVRNPGPKITSVEAHKHDENLSVKLIGENLDPQARFNIDGALQTAAGAVQGTPQGQGRQDYRSDLTFDLVRAASFADSADHTFEIINGDGIGAQAIFTAQPMKITAAAGVAAGESPATVTVTVENFRVGSTARWLAPGKVQAQVIEAKDVKPQPSLPTKIDVTLTPGSQKGSGTLTLVTPVGATEITTVAIT